MKSSEVISPIHEIPEQLSKDDFVVLFRMSPEARLLEEFGSFTWLSDQRPITVEPTAHGIIISSNYRHEPISALLRIARYEFETLDNVYLAFLKYSGFWSLRFFEDFLFYHPFWGIEPLILRNRDYHELLTQIEHDSEFMRIGEYSAVAPDGRPKSHVPDEGTKQSVPKLFRTLIDYERRLYDIRLHMQNDITLYSSCAVRCNDYLDLEELTGLLTKILSIAGPAYIRDTHLAENSKESTIEVPIMRSLASEHQLHSFMKDLIAHQFNVLMYSVFGYSCMEIYDSHSPSVGEMRTEVRNKRRSYKRPDHSPQHEDIAMQYALFNASSDAENRFIGDLMMRMTKWLGLGGQIGKTES